MHNGFWNIQYWRGKVCRKGEFRLVGWIIALIILSLAIYLIGRYVAPLLMQATSPPSLP